MTAIVLSDIHLTDATSLKAQLLIRFFQEVASRFENVYLLGDLFDSWPGTSAYLVRTYGPVIEALKRLTEGGCKVHYIEGNHDFWLGQFFTDRIGVQVHSDSLEENWNGKRVYLAHGDLGNPQETGYRILRSFFRWGLFHRLKSLLPQRWIHDWGLRYSQLSRKRQAGRRQKDAVIKATYRQTAEKLFTEGFDVVILGHTHIPDDHSASIEGRPCRYFNVGDWLSHFTYLEFDGSQFYTKTHPVKNV